MPRQGRLGPCSAPGTARGNRACPHTTHGSACTHTAPRPFSTQLCIRALSRVAESTQASGMSPGAIHPLRGGAQTLLAHLQLHLGWSHQAHTRLGIPGERRAGGSAPRCDGEGREGSESNQPQFRSGRESGSQAAPAVLQQEPRPSSILEEHQG